MATDDELRMSFTEHLAELRVRLIRCMYALAICAVAAYMLSDYIFAALAYPLTPVAAEGWFAPDASDTATVEGAAPPTSETPAAQTATPPTGPRWMVLNPLEYIVVQLKIAAYGGLLLALPFIIWQICAFVFPGLHPSERRAVQLLMVGCSSLAVLGVCVAYFGVFPLVLPYLMSWAPSFVEMQLRLNETLSILIKGILGFAIAFQFPMGVLVLVYMDLLTPQSLKDFRKIAVVGMAVISAVFTPPDPISMMIMLIPLVLLYELSILLSQLMIWRRKKRGQSAAQDAAL